MTRTLSVGGNQGRGDPCIRATAMHRIPELQTECGGEYVANGEGFPMAEQQASDDRAYWLLFLAVSAVFALITVIAAVTAYPNLR
jgi:hypothetical protein